MFQLPRNDRSAISVSLDNLPDESRRRGQKSGMGGGPRHRTFREWPVKPMLRHKEFRIAEVLDRANGQDHLLPGTFSCFKLLVELSSVELAGTCFDSVPVGAEANQIKRVCQQGTQRRLRVEAECLDLPGPKADPEQGLTAGLDRQLLPCRINRLLRRRQPRLHHEGKSNCCG